MPVTFLSPKLTARIVQSDYLITVMLIVNSFKRFTYVLPMLTQHVEPAVFRPATVSVFQVYLNTPSFRAAKPINFEARARAKAQLKQWFLASQQLFRCGV